MAEEKIVAPKDEQLKAQEEAAKKALAKDKTVQMQCLAYVDPDSFVQFDVSSRITQFFGIDLKPDGAPAEISMYGTSDKAAANANKKRSSIDGVGFMQKVGAGKRIYKAIQVPTGGNFDSGKKNKKFKSVTIRVPSAMNLNAIALWINTCFKTEGVRPAYFITQKGMKCFIDKAYKDKGKLRKLKEAAA